MTRPGCPLCGSRRTTVVSRQVRYATGQQVRQCAACTITFNQPFLTDEFYRRRFRQLYEPDARPAAVAAAGREEATRQFARHRRWLRPARTMLEIGCSCGNFMKLARRAGIEAVGIEPNDAQRRYVRRQHFSAYGDLADLPGTARFDLIAMFHVLEHLARPTEYLRRVSEHLTPRGRLLIEVPNVDDALVTRYALPEYRAFYWQPAHNYYFNRTTLTRVLNGTGLRFRLFPCQRYDLANHLAWAIHRAPGHDPELRPLLPAATSAAYARQLARHWHCDTLVAVGRR